MSDVQDLQTLTHGTPLAVPIPPTRFSASEMDLPYLPPPYTSLFTDMQHQINLHLYKDKLRQIALHPVKLHAGQSAAPRGELGRPATPDPVMLPEMLGGRVLKTNI